MYAPYADKSYYMDVYGGSSIPEEDIEQILKVASRHIDTLTYNRIVGMGINGLSPYQAEIVKECCCRLAEFEYANDDMINSVLKTYSVNGVSMTFDTGWNMEIHEGVVIKSDIYSMLSSTGLTSRNLRW